MGTIDIVLASLLVIALILGLRKGFIVQLASLLALVLGIYGATKFTGWVCDIFIDQTDSTIQNESYFPVVVFVVVFLLIVVAIHLLAWLIEKTFKLIAMNWVNRIVGGVFSILKWAVILSVLINVGEKFGYFAKGDFPEKYEEAILYHPIKEMAGFVLPPLGAFYDSNFGQDTTEEVES